MKINRTTFFAYVRKAPFGGSLMQSQVDGMNAILDHWETLAIDDARFLAYPLATAFHETGAKMQPVVENLNYTTAAQIRKTWPSRFASNAAAAPFVRQPEKLANKVYGGRMGNFAPGDGWKYRGRGLPQQTGREMYAKFGEEANPDAALDLKTSIRNMFVGMTQGIYTGKKLSDYFTASKDDAIGARAIINGKDKAKLIAGYYKSFLDAINAAIADYKDDGRKEDFVAPDVNPADAKPDDVPPAKSKSLWTIIGGLGFGGGYSALDAVNSGSSLLGAISNPWALLALLAVLCAGGALGWLVYTGRLQILHGKAVK